MRWEGRGMAEGGDSVVYSSVTLEVEGGEEHKVMAGSMLLVRPDREEDRSVAHFPCRVLHLAKRGGRRWPGARTPGLATPPTPGSSS